MRERRKAVHYGQIPTKLIRDPKISRSAKVLFGVYHSYSQEKDLRKKPCTYVSQKTIAKILNCTVQSVSAWTKELMEARWISVKHRGWMSNYIFLYGKKRRKRRQ